MRKLKETDKLEETKDKKLKKKILHFLNIK